MRLRWCYMFILVFSLFPLCTAFSEPRTESFASRIIEESRQTQQDARYTLSLIQMDRSQLQKERNRLTEQLSAAEEVFRARKETFQNLLDGETILKEAIESEKEEIKNVEDTLYNAAQRAVALIEKSPVSAEQPHRMEQLMPLISKQRFPGIEGVHTLVDIYWSELAASGERKLYEGRFIGPDYSELTGRIIRIGTLTAAFQTRNNDVGYLRTGENKKYVAVTGDLPWHVSSSLKSYFKGKTLHMPLDISGGTVFEMLSEKKDVADWLNAGGLLIWPLLLIGLVAIVLASERFAFLMRIRTNSDKIMADILGYVDREEWQACRDYCDKNNRFPTCRVLRSVFEHLNVSRETMENAIQEAILRQIPRLERFVATLAVLAAIAPLLGLLGTVTGMINTFQVITLFGTGDPKLMSGGISEALVTTQLGLAVAVPIILMHHFLERRIDKILGDIEEKGNKIVVALLKKGVITEGATAQ